MIKYVKVIDWCIGCKNCEKICPTIFKVAPKSKVISNNFKWIESKILQAELMCPVNVIKVSKKTYSNNLYFKNLFINWNIPWINIFSWIIIVFSLVWIPFLWNIIPTQTFWNISWWSVVFVIAIRPLSDLFPKLWMLSKLVFLRKAFWILSSSIVIIALSYKFYLNPNTLYNYFSLNNFSLTYPLISRVSEITWLILLLTSNNLSQKTLWIWWKRIHRLSYIYFISWWIIAAIWSPLKIYPAMWIVLFLWILASFNLKIWK